MPTKASVARNDPFENRWSVWGSAFGGGADISGNATLGSNEAEARAFGFAAGADYRISPATMAGFALAGGGTNFSVNSSGSGRSDMFQAGAFVRHTVGEAYVTGALAYGGQEVTTDRTVTVAGATICGRSSIPTPGRDGSRAAIAMRRLDGHHALCGRAVHHLRSAGLCRAGDGGHRSICAELQRQERHRFPHRDRRARRQVLCDAERDAQPERAAGLGA